MNENAYARTSTLISLALKRDKKRLTAWIIGLSLMTGLLTYSLKSVLATEHEIIIMINSFASNPAMRALLSPPSGVSIGGFFILRLSTFIVGIIAFFNVSTVVRHTRENEETRCEELIASTVVGRYATLLSAVIVAIISNLILAVTFTIAFLINGLPFDGSISASLSFAATGIVFASIAAITAQISETSRGAKGLAGLVIGFTFLISSIGNMLGEFDPVKLEVESLGIIWLSPFGWHQQIFAFKENNLWILSIFLVTFVICVRIAFVLIQKRDVGMGIIPAKKGPAFASPNLLTPLGFAWKLQKKSLVTWTIVIIMLGALFGFAMGEFNEALSSIERAEEIFGDVFSLNEVFIKMLIGLIGTFIVFYTVQGFGRMLHEENNGLLEPVLATAVSRTQWIMSHIICFGIGTLWLFIVLGLSGGIAAIGDSEVSILRILEASLVTSPGVFVLGGFFVMTFGLIPKFSKPLSWAAILISLIAGPLLGSALNLPENVQKLSPFTHLPGPMDDIKAAPIVILLLLTVIFFTLGIIGFKNRNLKTLKE